MEDNRAQPDMSAPSRRGDPPQDLPSARVTRNRWSTALIWVIPLIAAIVAGYLIYGRFKEHGPEITIRFRDGSGIRVGQTPILYRGVQVGEVTGVGLSNDQRRVEIRARLLRSAGGIAREGSVFWIVRPEVGFGSISGLGTVITGPEIQALPGTGEERTEFNGLDTAPAALELRGLRVVLRTDRLGSLQRNSPVYYRGVEVGVVQEATLSPDATGVHVHVLIRQRYARLVRANSVFWNVSGVSFKGGIFKGVEFKLESLRSLAAGGINFATPNDSARPVENGQLFPLHSDGRREWLSWAPRIQLPEDKEAAMPERRRGQKGEDDGDEPKADAPAAKPEPAKAAKKNPVTGRKGEPDSAFPKGAVGAGG
jgi:paraquat-inducible protein B